ncbi:MAG: VanZ family protein [Clostridiales bacterium]|nr:VanZ family protein [Clostridiales bacterium]
MELLLSLKTVFPLVIALLVNLALSLAIYRQWRRLHQPLQTYQGILLAVLSCWAAAAVVLVLLFPGNTSGQTNLYLFSTFRSAWNQWSLTELLQILLQFALFLPLGLLAALLGEPFCRLRWLLPVSISCTATLSCAKFALERGSFTLDDLLLNTLGTLTGFFLGKLIWTVWHKERLGPPLVKALVLPVCCLVALGGVFSVYYGSEFGNLALSPAYRQSMGGVTVTVEAALSEEEGTASVYRNAIASTARPGDTIASLLATEMNLNLSSTVLQTGQQRQFALTDQEGREYAFSISLRDGSWQFSSQEDEGVSVSGSLDSVRWRWESWLTQTQLRDRAAVYSLDDSGSLRWDMSAPEDLATYQNDFTAGALVITLTRGDVPASITSTMATYQYVQEAETLSPAEACQLIKQGRFSWGQALQRGDQLTVTGCQLTYATDSKGYYQPVYTFSCTVNGEETEAISVPALK